MITLHYNLIHSGRPGSFNVKEEGRLTALLSPLSPKSHINLPPFADSSLFHTISGRRAEFATNIFLNTRKFEEKKIWVWQCRDVIFQLYT